MNAKLNENTLIVTDEKGIKKEFTVLLSLDSEEENKSYIVFTDFSKNEEGAIEIHANVYEPNKDEFKLLPLENDREWKMIDNILKSATETIKEEM